MGYKDHLPKNYQANVMPGISSATINKVQELKTKEKNKTKYGAEVPTVEDISTQAAEIAKWDTEMDVTTYLNQAVTDGVVSPSDASSIFKNITGGELFGKENQQNVVAEAARRINGGTPMWVDSVSEKLYGNYSPEQASEKLAELDSKESLTPQEENDFNYLAKKYPEIALDLTGDRYSELKTSYDSEVAEIEKQISAIKKEMNFKSKAHELTPERRKELEAELKSLETKKKKLSTNLSKEQQKTALDNRALEFTVLSSVNDENFENYVNKGNNKNYKDFGSNKYYSAGNVVIESPDKYRAAAIALAEHNGQEVNLNGVSNYEIAIFRKMSDKEFQTFAYWLGKDEEKAKKYIDGIEEQLVYRQGADIAKDADKWYEKLDLSLTTGLEDTMLGIERNFKKEDYYAPSPNQAASYLVGEKLKKEGKTGQKTFYEGARTISAMAPSILVSTALSLAVPGAGAVTMAEKAANYIPKIAGLGVLGASARGNAYSEMINAGYTEKEANAYGNLVAASEIGLEFLIGGISKLGGISPKIEKLLEKTDNVFARMAIQFSAAFGSEAGEEGLQAFLEPYYKSMALGYDTGEKVSSEEVLYNALLGGFVGLFFESPEIITTNGKMYLADKTTGRRIYLNQNTEAFLEEAKMLGISEEKINKIKNAKNPKRPLGALLRHMVEDGQISEENALKLVSEGIDNIPLNEAEQAYYFAGARGIGINEAVKLNSNLTVDPDRAIAAWQRGAEKRTANDTARIRAGKVYTETDSKLAEAVKKNTERPKEIEKDKKRFYPEYTSYSSLDEPTISLGDAKYGKFRTNKPLTELGEDLVGIYAITGEIPETVLNKFAESVWNGTTLEKAEFTEEDSKAYDFIRKQENDDSLFLEYEDSWWEKLNELNPERFSNDIEESERQKVVEDFFHLYESAKEEQKVSDFYKNISALKEEIIRLTKKDYDGIEAYVGNNEYFYEPRTEEGKSDLAKLEDFAHKDRNKTTAVKNPVRSIVRENYNEAAEKFRTEENAELFDVAYNQGLLGERLNLGVIVPDKDISAVSQAYVAGTRDARIIAERRANFDNRTPGLFTDAVTEQLSKKFGSRTLNAIDALGKKLGVQIRFIQRGEAGHERYSYYSPSDGVIAINVNEIHGKLTGDKLLRFIANHEGIHRIKETSPKAYAEMEKIAISKSKQTVEDRMARFGESKERATEEIVADYFGEVLTSKAEIKSLLNKHRSVFDAIMEALEWLVDKMRGIANYSFSEIAEARKLFQEALAEADANVWGAEVRSDGETVYSAEFSFSKQVEDALSGKMKRGYSVYVGKTPNLLTKAGLPADLPMLINQGHLRDINAPKDPNNRHLHGIDKDTIKQLPSLLKNPVMIYDSISEDNKENTVCVLTNKKNEDGEPIIVAISYSEQGNKYLNVEFVKQKTEKSNFVKSMYGREGFIPHLTEIIDTDAVLYVNKAGIEKVLDIKNETLKLNSDSKLELLARLDSLGFDTIIHQSNNVVKGESSDKLQSRSDPDIFFSRSEDSEDNVKYFPPGEDPRRDIKVPSEINGKKVRRFTRTAAESPALTPEMAEDVVSEIENGRFYYTPSSNKALADNAMNKVENDVIKAASEWKTAFDSGKMITDKDIAIGEALIIEAGKRGDTERAIELISEVGIAATEAGKSVQAIKLLKRMTPEGQVYYLSKVVERLNKERGKTKGKEFDKSIEAENKATEADKKYKQAETKVKTVEEKLFDIETAIEEYTKDLDIEVKIAESVEKIADFKKQLSEVKGKVKSADANSEKLGNKIKEIEGQLEEERKKLKEAMEKRDAIRKERAEKGIMLSKLKAGVKRVNNATDHILGKIDILENDISKVEAEYDKAVKFRDECAEERRRLIKEKNSLIRKTESADKASERDLKKISQLEEEISKLSDKYLVAKKTAEDAAEIRKQLKAERNELRHKLAKIENAIDYRETEIAKLKEEIAQLLNAEYEASKELEKAKEERTLKQKARDKARKLSSAAKMGANIIELPADIKKAILESKTDKELNKNVELAKDYIAENMVATKAEMIRAWRYLSMLGNLRTQVRNIIGNGLMLVNVYFKNAVGTLFETIAIPSHKKLEKQLAKMKDNGATEEELTAYRDEHYAERTKTITLFKKKSDALKSFVTESWESNIKLAKGQSGKNDNIIGDINDRRTIFKSEKPVLKQVAAGVEAWRKATNWAMENGDEFFLRINYKHALTSYILSNKWDVATMTEAQKLRAEQYALKEAQEATFRDESEIANWINKGRNKGWAAELAIGGLLPFTKTPINITKRSIEYGPTGIVNSIVQGVKASKGQATSADVVNALAKTFSGSVLAGLGFYLAAKGLLRSKGDEEDEEYNYLIGEQDYSLMIGDYRFSLEWAAPATIPLLFGAAIYNACFDKDGGIKEEYMVDENGNLVLNTRAMAIHKVMNAASAMFAPIFEASYLSGLTDSIGAAFSFGSGDASEGLAIFGINAGLSYANQFIPTVFGQLARTIDFAERRNNDYNKTLPLSYSVQKGIAKAKNKIPGLNQTSTPYVNAWGEEEIKQGALDYILSGAENIILPGYIEKVTDDKLTDELWRLEKTEAAEEKKVFPESVKTSYTEDGKTIPLTAEQRNERQKVAGQKGREYIEAFYNSDEYGKLTDAERVKAIDLLWAKANEEGIQAVRPDYVSKDSNVIKMNITEKNVGISPVDYTLWKIAYEKADEDENGSYNTDEVNAALDIFIELSGEEWTAEQLGYLWETRASALSKSNPYGRALLGTPWYQRKKEEGNTWMRERE